MSPILDAFFVLLDFSAESGKWTFVWATWINSLAVGRQFIFVFERLQTIVSEVENPFEAFISFLKKRITFISCTRRWKNKQYYECHYHIKLLDGFSKLIKPIRLSFEF